MGKELLNYYYDYETKHYQANTLVAGFDEAGRGAIAGPIVVACVILPSGFAHPLIKDSKQLTLKQREKAYKIIIDNALDYAFTIVSLQVIEKINPKQASVIGMEIAFQNLTINPDVCLIDFENPHLKNFKGEKVSLIKGDQKSLNIAAASIVAKITRDKIMVRLSHKYPSYNFDKHKGYFTKSHQSALKQYGVLEIHRKKYGPIKNFINETTI